MAPVSSTVGRANSPAQSKSIKTSADRSPVRETDSPDTTQIRKKNDREIVRLEELHKERIDRLKRQSELEKRELDDVMARRRQEHRDELDRLEKELREKRRADQGGHVSADNTFSLETKIASLEKENEKWRNLYTEATEKLVVSENLSGKQKNEILALRDEIAKGEESFLRQLKDSKDKIQTAFHEKEGLERELKEVKARLLALEGESGTAHISNSDETGRTLLIMKTEERKLRNEIADLRDQLDAAVETSRRSQRVEESLRRDVSTLEALQNDKLSRKDKAIQEAKDELESANTLLRERKKRIDDLSQQMATLEAEKSAVERQYKSLLSAQEVSKISSSLDTSASPLLAQYEEAERTIFGMKLEEKKLRTELAELQDQLDQAMDNLRRSQRTEESLKRDVSTLETLHSDKIARKDQALQELRSDLEAATSALSRSKKENEAANHEIFKLNEQLKVLEQLTRSAQLASLNGEDVHRQLAEARVELQVQKASEEELREELERNKQQFQVKAASMLSLQTELEDLKKRLNSSSSSANFIRSSSSFDVSGVSQELLEITEKQLDDARGKVKAVSKSVYCKLFLSCEIL
jgi:hypothetical protein